MAELGSPSRTGSLDPVKAKGVIEGVPVDDRTRLTSCVPSSFHRSTLKTNMELSMSLSILVSNRVPCAFTCECEEGVTANAPVVNFLACVCIQNDESNTRRRRDRTAVLSNISQKRAVKSGELLDALYHQTHTYGLFAVAALHRV